MAPARRRTTLIAVLKAVMALSIAGAGVMLLIAWPLGLLGGVVARILLTFVALLFGSLLMQVQLRQRRRRAREISKLLCLGIAVIAVSQISFLTLVWTHWTARRLVWQIWWISMVPSVFVTHLLLIRSARRPRAGRSVQHVAAVCIIWAGLMILCLGLRADMFAPPSQVYLWIGSVPAAGTIVCSLILAFGRFLRVGDRRRGAKRGLVAGVLMSHIVLALAGFYIGRATHGDDPDTLADSAVRDLGEQFDRDWYAVQSRAAEYLGDTKIIGRDPFITVKQIEAIQQRLEPGDILLERRNWYLSNPFLPGFWPHAALYIGTMDDLDKLGVLAHPAMQKHLAALRRPADDGRPRTILEAVSEGVVLMSATHSLHADYVAVLRPRLRLGQIAHAIVQAFEHRGKAYDFNFDFDDREKLICTQLIYEAYRGMIDFKIVRVMGRNTLPALDIALKYAVERRSDSRQLDFVLFLDGVPSKGIAREATELDFLKSLTRPRALVEN